MLRYFANRTMRFKLTFVFLSVVLVPMLLLAYISYNVINSRLIDHAEEEVGMGLKSAWTEYYARGSQMRYGMLQAAAMEEIKAAVGRRDKAYLETLMARWKQMRPYVDIWAVTDENGVVIARLNGGYAGDTIKLNGSLEHAVSSLEPSISTEIMPRDVLKLHGNGVIEQVGGVVPFEGASTAEPAPDETASEFMALMVVTPVLDDARRPIGTIVTGDVLNKDDHIPSMMSARLPGLFTTISMGGRRIATNLADSRGRSLIGARMPESSMAALASGNGFIGGWSFGGVDFISAVEPIRDFRGNVIGSLGASIARDRLWVLQKENQRVITVVTLLGLSFSLFASLLSTYKITRPLEFLKSKMSAFASGDMSVRVACDEQGETSDELTILARTFNAMMDEVSSKEAEKKRHLDAIEERNREFAKLNEALTVKNEEIEIAYEETQSQTEELHAINEELKLLNDDLDRKNAELKKANTRITEEELELKDAKDKLRFIYDSIRDFILLVDYDHAILEANRHFTEALNTQEEAVIGKDIFETLSIKSPKGRSPVRMAIDAMQPVEAELSNGVGRVFMLHAYPFIDAAASPGRAVVYIKDITEQRMLAHKLMQTDKLSSLGELVSGVAHELNNPLTGIMCFSELMMGDDLPVGTEAKLKRINDASHRCKKIIDNLLTFARWKMPEKSYEDINKVIRDSVELRSYQLKVDNIKLEMDLDPLMPSTMLDEGQVHQVFVNLINNASDAIKSKGEGGLIKIRSEHRDRKIVVSFEDSGTGIAEEVVNRIFDPFYTTKSVGKGTGLGLSISYGIINEHGGNIYASSSPGAGTTFVVELPVLDKTVSAADNAAGDGAAVEGAAELAAMASGKRVLVLDDEPIVLDLLHDALGGAGFHVDKTSSGKEALSLLKDTDYDVIISDIKMPGVDGKDFYRGVKAVKPELLRKIVFISGDSLNKETQSFLKKLGNYSLKKPFTVDQLNHIISKVIY